MNLLATVLPGVRELRTPITIGALWLTALALWPRPRWASVSAEQPGLPDLLGTVKLLPLTYRLVALGFGAYILGCVLGEVATYTGGLLRSLTRSAVKSLLSRTRVRSSFRYGGRLSFVTARLHQADAALAIVPAAIRSSVIESAASAYARIGAPAGAHLAVPVDDFIEDVAASSRQMWQTAPQQAQEYDRLLAESAFRAGVVPPLFAIAAVVSAAVSWWVVAAAVPALAILLSQAHAARREAEEVLTASMYLGYVKLPVIEALADELVRLKVEDDGDPTWAAATLVALNRLNHFDAAQSVWEEAPSLLFETDDENDAFESYVLSNARGYEHMVERRQRERTDEAA